MSKSIPLEDLLRRSGVPFALLNPRPLTVTGVRSLVEAGPTDVSFAQGRYIKLLASSRAGAVATTADEGTLRELPNFDSIIWILTAKPRRLIIDVAQAFEPPPPTGIDRSAVIHPSARIGDGVAIGPLSSIGQDVVIGERTVIREGVHLLEGVELGRRVVVGAGTVVGSVGFGYERDGDGSWVRLPHLGRVVVGDDVEIGQNTCVHRGTFGDTVIERGARIGSLVLISHNVTVGESALVISSSMIGGSASIGAGVWVAPSSAVMNGAKLGEGSSTGLGAVVIGDVEPHDLVAGVPAKSLGKRRRT